MSKSRARLLAELLNSSGLVKKSKSALAGADEVIDLDSLPTITNAKLENSSISVAGHSVSLGGSVSLDTEDISEHTSYLYYTNARARGAISVSGSTISYDSSTGVITSSANNYVLPFTDNSSNWNTAYGWGNHANAGYITDGNTNWNNSYGFITASDSSITNKLPLAGGTLTGALQAQPWLFRSMSNQVEYHVLDNGSINGPSWKFRYDGGTANRYVDFGYKDGYGTYSSGLKLYNNQIISWKGTDIINASAQWTGGIASSGYNNSNWNTAYGWGNHASAGYLTSHQSLAAYAPLASPGLTGTPTAPTATAGTNTTQIATTAFVGTAVSNLVDSAPGTLDTLNELAAALGDDANFSTTVTNSIATKLPLAGGTLTGKLTLNDAGYSLGNEYHKWKRAYTVNTSSPQEILYSDGTSLPTGGVYRFTAHISATGTDQFATAVYWNQNGTWRVNVTGQSGTSSNHPEFIIDATTNKPTIHIDHASSYGIHILGERIELDEGTGTDNAGFAFGTDAFLGSVNNDLYFLPGGTAATGQNSYDDGNVVWHTGNLTTTNKSNYDTAYGWGNHASAGYVVGNTSNAINLTITGVMQANNGYKVGTSTVIDSSRNLTNIGTISSGAITTTGNFINNTNGGIFLKSNTSEANNWLFKESAANWGIYYFNAGSEAGATVGAYTTVGAEYFLTSSVSGYGPVMPSTWTGTQSGSYLNIMLSPYRGYIYAGDQIEAKNGYRLGGTTVLDSSRNLTNIGTISSGAITSTGIVEGAGVIAKSGNSASTYVLNQISFGYSGSTSYQHGIKTRHNSGTGTGNAFDFFLWNSGTDATGDIGSLRVASIETGKGIDIVSGGLQIAGTTVIDSNRNLTGINTYSGSGDVVAQASNVMFHARSSADGQTVGYRAGYLNHASLQAFFRYTTGDAQLYIDNDFEGNNGLYSNINFRNKANGGASLVNRLTIHGSTGNVNVTGGNLQMSGTTVIDSSRNLTNINAITSAGVAALTRGNGSVGAPNTANHATGTRIELYNASATSWYAIGIESDTMWFNSDNHYRFYTDAVSKVDFSNTGVVNAVGGYKVNGTTFIDASRNLTNIGTISSGAITATTFNATGADTTPAGTAFANTMRSTSTRVLYLDGNGATSLWQGSGNTAHAAIDTDGTYQSFWANNGSGWQKQMQIARGFIDLLNPLKMNDTTVIDSSRNISAGTISSGAITSTGSSSLGNGTTIGTVELDGNSVGIQEAGLLFQPNSAYRCIHPTSMTATSHTSDISLGWSNNKWKDIYLAGFVKADSGYQVGTTTVIDSSRNLTNIGTISNTGKHSSSIGSYATYSRPLLEITSSGTPTQIKITTNIPYTGTSHAHSVTIRGFQYGGANTVDLQISWHVYSSSFYNRTATSSGAWTPTITLAVENNKVVIHLAGPGYWPKMYVESMYNAFGGASQAGSWSWSDAAISADANTPNQTVPYKSAFGNGISMSSSGLTAGTISSGAITSTGNLTLTADAYITNNTSDGSDNGSINISGGGAFGDTRGASLGLAGNENGNGGMVQIRAGQGSYSQIRMYSGGTERVRMDNGGLNILSGTLEVGSTTVIDASRNVTPAFLANTAGAKLEVMNANETSGHGIYMWDSSDTNWGIYMATAGSGKSLSGGTACTSLDGRTGANSHHVRFRTFGGDALRGWIFENHLEAAKVSITSDTGNIFATGFIDPVNGYKVNGTTVIDASRIFYAQTRVEIQGSGGWAYTRLKNSGSTMWDIAANPSDNSSALQFRPFGSGTNATLMSTSGNWTINGTITTTGKATIDNAVVADSLHIRGDAESGYSKASMVGGISLWGNTGQATSQIMFKPTNSGSPALGNHGFCTDSYNTYFAMDTTGRGWVFRNSSTDTNVASISTTGGAAFNGGLQINGTQVINSSRLLENVTLQAGASGARLKVDSWHQDSGGRQRFYFENTGRTYFGSGGGYIFRDSSDAGRATISNDGGLNLRSGGDGLVGSGVALAVSGTTFLNSSRDITARQATFTHTTHNYVAIEASVNAEQMVRFKNSASNYWYAGIRTSAGIASALDFHIYSTALGDDAFALTTGGDLVAKRNLNTKTGNVQINGTTVIDSSRQLRNVTAHASEAEYGQSMVGNFGQWLAHSRYTPSPGFNSDVDYWGWNFVQGAINAPHTASGQWYRNRVALGDAYGHGISSGDYWLEMAYPRYNQNQAGSMYIRACESGSIGSWYEVGANIRGSQAVTGSITAQGNITAYSDERLKSSIETLDGSKVLQMRGVSFIKNEEAGSGVIAQELEKIAPELVHDNKDGYKSVAYGNLVGYLIEAVKEQQNQINAQKEQITQLTKMVNALMEK